MTKERAIHRADEQPLAQPVSLLLGWDRPTSITHRRRRPDGIELYVHHPGPSYYAVAKSPTGYLLSGPLLGTLSEGQRCAELVGCMLAAALTVKRASPVRTTPRSGGQATSQICPTEVPRFPELATKDAKTRGQVIRELRRQLRLTKKDLAKLACVSIPCLRRLENGFGRTRPASVRLILAALRTVNRLSTQQQPSRLACEAAS